MPNFSDILEKRDLSPPFFYGISDRRAFSGLKPADYLQLLFQTRAQILQWREKDLEPEENRSFIGQGVRLAGQTGRVFLVNSLADLALEEGACGVHLNSTQSIRDACRLREHFRRPDFVIGQSVHSFAEAEAAERSGADYVLLSPIFAPLSKDSTRPPLGRTTLLETVQALSIPVIALGGIDESNMSSVLRTGAAGVAGITWLQKEVQALLAAC